MIHDVVVIGSGPAGLTAGIYAARANLKPLLVEGMRSGGQLVQTTEVENFPGFSQPIKGPDLMAAMRAQAERCGVEFLMDEIQDCSLDGEVKKLETMMGATIEARTLVICTGAAARWTGIAGETKYRNHGVSACATCDGSFYRDADVAVIGGGDTAMGDALYLARLCRKVHVIHRRDAFRASKTMAERVLADPRIEVHWNSVVDEFLGDGRKLSALRLRSTVEGGGDVLEVPVSGAFVAIGHDPETKLFAGKLDLDAAGYVKVDRSRTSVPGVFAAGDCADPFYKQAVVAAGAGAAAALEAERYLLS